MRRGELVERVGAPGSRGVLALLAGIRIDSIQRSETIGTADNWRARKQIIFPLRRNSMCQIVRERQSGGATLGIFRPAKISRLVIRDADPPDWTRSSRIF